MSTTNERSQNDIVVGDGVVTVIPFQFNYFPDTNISVLVTLRDETDPDNIVETELIEATDYTLFDDRIELTNPLLTDQFLLVERIVKDVQPLDYDDLRPFPEEVHERQEDRTFMSLAEIKNKFKRTILYNKFMSNEIVVEDPVDGQYLFYRYDAGTDTWTLSSSSATVDLTDFYTRSEVDTLLLAKEDTIVAGVATEYYRGDKTWATLDKDAVGLDQVDNTSDLDKPISTDTQDALNLKANLVHTHDLDNLNQSGAVSGQVPVWNGAQWEPQTPSSGVTDHGLLSGLGDDDHPQYLTDARGDARYYTQGQVDSLISSLFPVGFFATTLVDSPPNGLNWLKLNIDDVLTQQYIELDNVIHADLISYLHANGMIVDDPPEWSDYMFGRFSLGGGQFQYVCMGFGALSPRGYGNRLLQYMKEGPEFNKMQEDQMQRITGGDPSGGNLFRGNLTTGQFGAINISGGGSYSYSGYSTSGGSDRRNVVFDSSQSPQARTSVETYGETRINAFGVYYWIRY